MQGAKGLGRGSAARAGLFGAQKGRHNNKTEMLGIAELSGLLPHREIGRAIDQPGPQKQLVCPLLPP